MSRLGLNIIAVALLNAALACGPDQADGPQVQLTSFGEPDDWAEFSDRERREHRIAEPLYDLPAVCDPVRPCAGMPLGEPERIASFVSEWSKGVTTLPLTPEELGALASSITRSLFAPLGYLSTTRTRRRGNR